MAWKKKTLTGVKRGKTHSVPGGIFTDDVEDIPIAGVFGRSVELTFPDEYRSISALEVGKSGTFPTDKLRIINAVRARIHKLTGKNFTVRKIDAKTSRLWRVPDRQIKKHSGGRIAGVSPWKKGVPPKPKEENKARGWGGPRVKGQKLDKRRGPKLTHKDGSPIVPVVNSNEVVTENK